MSPRPTVQKTCHGGGRCKDGVLQSDFRCASSYGLFLSLSEFPFVLSKDIHVERLQDISDLRRDGEHQNIVSGCCSPAPLVQVCLICITTQNYLMCVFEACQTLAQFVHYLHECVNVHPTGLRAPNLYMIWQLTPDLLIFGLRAQAVPHQ